MDQWLHIIEMVVCRHGLRGAVARPRLPSLRTTTTHTHHHLLSLSTSPRSSTPGSRNTRPHHRNTGLRHCSHTSRSNRSHTNRSNTEATSIQYEKSRVILNYCVSNVYHGFQIGVDCRSVLEWTRNLLAFDICERGSSVLGELSLDRPDRLVGGPARNLNMD
jgi:hypothetical protein